VVLVGAVFTELFSYMNHGTTENSNLLINTGKMSNYPSMATLKQLVALCW
jgi:hypothetical protein